MANANHVHKQRNLVARNDFNRGGAHRSAKDYVRTRLSVQDALDEFEEPLWDDEESMCDMLDIPYEDVYQSKSLIDFFFTEDYMKKLKRALGALDIETISRPKEASFAGQIPIMTTYAFAVMLPDFELPVILLGKLDVQGQIHAHERGGLFHLCADTENWWHTNELINNDVRASQLRTWNNSEELNGLLIPTSEGSYNFTLSKNLSELEEKFTYMVGKYGHMLGNGPEFDMHIFDLHFKNHSLYNFWEVGSARTLKFLAKQRFSGDVDTYRYVEDLAHKYATYTFGRIPESFIKAFDLVPNYHDALFDALSEVHLSHTILTDAIN